MNQHHTTLGSFIILPRSTTSHFTSSILSTSNDWYTLLPSYPTHRSMRAYRKSRKDMKLKRSPLSCWRRSSVVKRSRRGTCIWIGGRWDLMSWMGWSKVVQVLLDCRWQSPFQSSNSYVRLIAPLMADYDDATNIRIRLRDGRNGFHKSSQVQSRQCPYETAK